MSIKSSGSVKLASPGTVIFPSHLTFLGSYLADHDPCQICQKEENFWDFCLAIFFLASLGGLTFLYLLYTLCQTRYSNYLNKFMNLVRNFGLRLRVFQNIRQEYCTNTVQVLHGFHRAILVLQQQLWWMLKKIVKLCSFAQL